MLYLIIYLYTCVYAVSSSVNTLMTCLNHILEQYSSLGPSSPEAHHRRMDCPIPLFLILSSSNWAPRVDSIDPVTCITSQVLDVSPSSGCGHHTESSRYSIRSRMMYIHHPLLRHPHETPQPSRAPSGKQYATTALLCDKQNEPRMFRTMLLALMGHGVSYWCSSK